MNLFTNLQNPISSIYIKVYFYTFIHIKYNITYTQIKSHTHELFHEHIIIFGLGFFLFFYK